MTKFLTCYATGDSGGWEAICVDFDIAVQGKSFEEVFQELKVAIREYVESAKQERPEQAERLLTRRAPVLVRLAHGISFLRAWFLDGSRNDGQAAGFTVTCPM